MPRARNRFERVNQVLRWMADNWPTGRKVELLWRNAIRCPETGKLDPRYQGLTYREGAKIVIEMRRSRCRECLIDTIMHEFAHAKLWPVAGRAEHEDNDHPPAFWALYGEIVDRYQHDHGREQSMEYPVD